MQIGEGVLALSKECQIELKSVSQVLQMTLRIPAYQRPYKWSWQNASELLDDITENAGREVQYRVGTVILHREGDCRFIVDGQQRILTLILIILALDPNFTCPLMSDDEFQKSLALDKESQRNLHNNFLSLSERIRLLSEDDKKKVRRAFSNSLEFVVICVWRLPEAFQLFDSQNTRGKRLNPHDLLKAYHLREMGDDKYRMEHAVIKWEKAEKGAEKGNYLKIRDLFNYFLFPILSWSNNDKCGTFTEKDIYLFKGVSSDSRYTYGRRTIKAMPCYQLTEQFEAGEHFFGMVEHYLDMLQDVEREVYSWKGFSKLLTESGSTGLSHARRLFLCALTCYYDRFANFDRLAIIKLCQWAFMIRIDMEALGFDTINKYALGESQDKYSNAIPMFRRIKNARSHLEISGLQIAVASAKDCKDSNEERKMVQRELANLMRCEVEHG